MSNMKANSLALYQAISAAETVICKPCTMETNATSCAPMRTLSMSEVMRLTMRPYFVLLKKDIGMAMSLRNKSARMSWATASPSSNASRWRKWKVAQVKMAIAKKPPLHKKTLAASRRAMGPLIVAPIIQASIGNCNPRRSVKNSSQLRRNACGRV